MGDAEQQHVDWLARSFGQPGYEPLRAADLDALERVGQSVSLPPGTYLFREGSKATAAFVIEQGQVEIFRGSGAGRRVVAHAGPGSVLGDVAMFSDRPHIADARASSLVRARRFERSRLLPELAVNPGVLLRWLVAALDRLEDTQRRVVGLLHKTVLAQVADLLLEESVRQPDVNLSQSTMATLLGVSRQSVNEALGQLRTLAIVDTGYRRVTVLDRTRLAEIANPPS